MMDALARAGSLSTPLRDGDMLAAIDLGSNSFHMVVAAYTLGQLRIVDRLREPVRMAVGLDARGGLDRAVRDRALACLARFGQRIRDIPPQRVRALATNTVRLMAAPQSFLVPAETALGHGIVIRSRGGAPDLLAWPRPATRRATWARSMRRLDRMHHGRSRPSSASLQVGASGRRLRLQRQASPRKWQEAVMRSARVPAAANAYRAGWNRAMPAPTGDQRDLRAMKLAGVSRPGAAAGARPPARGRRTCHDLPGPPSAAYIAGGGCWSVDACPNAWRSARRRCARACCTTCWAQRHDPRRPDPATQRYGIDQPGARVEGTAIRLFEQAPAWARPDDLLMLAWRACTNWGWRRQHQSTAYVIEPRHRSRRNNSSCRPGAYPPAQDPQVDALPDRRCRRRAGRPRCSSRPCAPFARLEEIPRLDLLVERMVRPTNAADNRPCCAPTLEGGPRRSLSAGRTTGRHHLADAARPSAPCVMGGSCAICAYRRLAEWGRREAACTTPRHRHRPRLHFPCFARRAAGPWCPRGLRQRGHRVSCVEPGRELPRAAMPAFWPRNRSPSLVDAPDGAGRAPDAVYVTTGGQAGRPCVAPAAPPVPRISTPGRRPTQSAARRPPPIGPGEAPRFMVGRRRTLVPTRVAWRRSCRGLPAACLLSEPSIPTISPVQRSPGYAGPGRRARS